MPDLYEFKKIEGKGFGCVAVKAIKKGTVILQEAPQCVAKGVENFLQFNPTQSGLRDFGLNIMSAFNGMCQHDRKAFLKLRNKFKDEEIVANVPRLARDLDQWTSVFKESKDKEELLNVIGIYSTHCSGKGGLYIKLSQFSHSCQPNSVQQVQRYSVEGTASSEVKDVEGSTVVQLIALKNIKAGQEITCNILGEMTGSSILMLNRGRRLKHIEQMGQFHCVCDRCLVDDTDPTVNYEKLQELIFEEAELVKDYQSIVKFAENISKRKWGPECAEEFRTIQQKFPFEKCRRHVQIIRLLYNHGREKKAQTLCLFTLLKNGYNTTMVGALLCWDHRNRQTQFKKDGVEFAQAAAKYGKILPKEVEDPSKWKGLEQFRRSIPICYPSYVGRK